MKVNYKNILSPNGLVLPLSLADLSGNLPRAELEVGFGNGEFTVAHAAQNPDTFIAGMEVSPSCILRCAKRAGELKNLKLVRTDARYMMKELFSDESLDRVYMNFPCPWPKTRHARRRVTATEFADDLASVLKIGGIFELVTDEEWYSLEARSVLAAHVSLNAAGYEKNPARPVTTKYERKWLDMGKDIYRLTIVKTSAFTVKRRSWGIGNMHIKTGKPLPAGVLDSLFDVSGINGESRWVFKKYYTSSKRSGGFLVETVSTDDDYEQRYYIKVAERDGDTIVKLDGTAQAFLTPSVRFAVEDLAARLGCEGLQNSQSSR